MNSLRASILLRLAALALLIGAAAAVSFGYLGWVHPAFDAFSHFRIHLAAGLILLTVPLLVLRYLPEALFAAVLGATAFMQTTGLPPLTRVAEVNASDAPQPPVGAVYSLMQLNLRFDNPTPGPTLSLIGRLKPDVITLNEVSAAWMSRLQALNHAYPFTVFCPTDNHIGGSAILSRRPFVAGDEPRCGDNGSFAAARYDFGGKVVEVAALHLGWPWPFHQPWQLPRIKPLLERIGGTAIVAGDLNSVPWSHTARQVSEASGARLLRGIGPTWLDRRLPVAMRPLIGLPIDNVLVKGGVIPVDAGTSEWVGSDHLPILMKFMLLEEAQPATVLQAMADGMGMVIR